MFIFKERVREGKRGGEKPLCVRETLISCLAQVPHREQATTQAGALTRIKLAFSLQDDAQPNEPHQSGHVLILQKEKEKIQSEIPQCSYVS